MVVLENVTRLNSGVYTCTSTDTDNFDMVSGNTTVFVNCKEPAHIWLVTMIFITFYQQNECRQQVWYFLSLPALCIDLDPAVVIPNDVEVSQGEELTATCNALSSLQTHTVWFKVTDTQQYSNSTLKATTLLSCTITNTQMKEIAFRKPIRLVLLCVIRYYVYCWTD